MDTCCFKAFTWEGTPTGTTQNLEGVPNPAYVSGDNNKVAILMVHDGFGWTFNNTRLLADHYAREIGATVYVPDFYGGEVLDHSLLLADKWDEAGLWPFIARNSREIREPEIFAYAKALRLKGYDKIGAVGFCYGGWAVARLAAAEGDGKPLVDAISAGHPSLLTKEDIDGVAVPSQWLSPEHDPVYTAELKAHTVAKLQEKNLPFDYQYFPGIEHGAMVRGDEKRAGERAAMVRAKVAVVLWMKTWLLPSV